MSGDVETVYRPCILTLVLGVLSNRRTRLTEEGSAPFGRGKASREQLAVEVQASRASMLHPLLYHSHQRAFPGESIEQPRKAERPRGENMAHPTFRIAHLKEPGRGGTDDQSCKYW